jgi:hypothetical protein
MVLVSLPLLPDARATWVLECALLANGERAAWNLACASATKVRIERRDNFIAFSLLLAEEGGKGKQDLFSLSQLPLI